MRRNPEMITEYKQDLRLFPTRPVQVGMLALALLWLYLPSQLDDGWLGVLNAIAVTAIGGIGLNLLSGYTGQVSLGNAFFMGVGGFAALYFAKAGVPMLGWLLLAALVGGGIGALIGPVALRLHGNYLAIVTVGLLFVGEHVFSNWRSLSGGKRGTNIDVPLSIGPLNFAQLDFAGMSYTRDQGMFWFLWALVAFVAFVAKNIVRSRPGRAMQAIRDRDIAAEVVGVSLVRYKLGAFAVSSGFAALAGAIYGVFLNQHLSPVEFGGTAGLVLSIQFVAVIIIGGMGTIYGSILGALLVGGLPRVIERFSGSLPLLGDDGLISVASFNNALFGVLVVVFLLAEPLGLAGVWMRTKAYFKSWPFSY